ncbi:unnamed protein product [Laminaria digitata]
MGYFGWNGKDSIVVSVNMCKLFGSETSIGGGQGVPGKCPGRGRNSVLIWPLYETSSWWVRISVRVPTIGKHISARVELAVVKLRLSLPTIIRWGRYGGERQRVRHARDEPCSAV